MAAASSSKAYRQILVTNALALSLCACGTSAPDSPGVVEAGSTASTTASTTGTTGDPGSTTSSTSAAAVSGTTGTATNGSAATSSGAGGAGVASVDGGTVTTTSSGGAGTGGASTNSDTTSSTSGSGTGCTIGPWPTSDPSAPGPYETVTENDVGPTTGTSDEGEPIAFTLFRPDPVGQDGLCHPLVTWGNGTGSNPSLYGVLLRHLASHGFVVIASDSPNVGSGDPPPMLTGVDWVLEQNDDPSSELYQHIDATHVGATGHSQGGFATTAAAGDSRITAIAPLCGASSQRNLHGPALLLCGGQDETVPCSNIQTAFDAINDQPAMLANYLSADHANWITFNGTNISPMEVLVTAWMRVHLMADDALRSWFYGPSCTVCSDSAWQISQRMLDQ